MGCSFGPTRPFSSRAVFITGVRVAVELFVALARILSHSYNDRVMRNSFVHFWCVSCGVIWRVVLLCHLAALLPVVAASRVWIRSAPFVEDVVLFHLRAFVAVAKYAGSSPGVIRRPGRNDQLPTPRARQQAASKGVKHAQTMNTCPSDRQHHPHSICLQPQLRDNWFPLD